MAEHEPEPKSTVTKPEPKSTGAKSAPKSGKPLALTCFIAAILLQGYISGHPELIPQAVDIGKEPLTASTDLGEAIVVRDPVVQRPLGQSNDFSDDVLFTHLGAPGEVVDVRFDSARLSPTSLTLLSGGSRLPQWLDTDGPMHYYVRGSAKELAGAQALVSVRAVGKPPDSLTFLQSMPAGDMAYRSFTIRATGASLAVRLQVQPPAPNPDALGAPESIPSDVIGLEVGSNLTTWTHTSPGIVPVDVIAAPGSTITLTFTPAANTQLWSTGTSLYDPFNESSLALGASAISVDQTSNAGASTVESLSVTHWMGQKSELVLKSLKIGSDQLIAAADGFAVRYPPGEDSPNLFERIEKQPLLAMVLGALNLALLGWVRREFFPKSLQSEAEKEIAEEAEEREKKKNQEEEQRDEMERARERELAEQERAVERQREQELEREEEQEKQAALNAQAADKPEPVAMASTAVDYHGDST